MALLPFSRLNCLISRTILQKKAKMIDRIADNLNARNGAAFAFVVKKLDLIGSKTDLGINEL